MWDITTANEKLGYEYTAGPIVVRGKVIAGITGCGRYKDDVCFISGHDAATGKELWRTSTIARPGEPGGDSWGDLPLTFRAGADAWQACVSCHRDDLRGDNTAPSLSSARASCSFGETWTLTP